MNRVDVPWLREKAMINPHNFRETLLAFGGLVRCRHSLWAREAGFQLVRAMDRSLGADGSFDFTELGSYAGIKLLTYFLGFIVNLTLSLLPPFVERLP